MNIDVDFFEEAVRARGIRFHGTVINGDHLYLVDENGEEIHLNEAQRNIVNEAVDAAPPSPQPPTFILYSTPPEDHTHDITPSLLPLLEALGKEDGLSDETKGIIAGMRANGGD